MASISARSSSSIPSNPEGMYAVNRRSGGFRRGALHQEHLLHAVNLLELHFDNFDVGCLHGPADKPRLDGQLTMSPIDEDEKLHARRAAMIEEGVERRADGAAR